MLLKRALWKSLILLGFSLTSICYAQIRSATITGTVVDQSGGIVANADVVITNQETNVTNNTKTTDAGQFTFPYLQAGVYTVAVNAPGFAPYRQTGVALAVAQTFRVDVNLKVGAVGATIEVQAQAAQVQTDSATVQAAMQSELIAALPNPVQNPMYYAMLQAGVVPRNATADSTSINSFGIGVNGRRQWSALGVNGGRTFTNDIQLDGLPVMGGGYNEASVMPNTEGLAEVRVIANNFSAQYGHGQAVVAMSTKSGTNQFHGQADYRLRNEALQANTAANNANNVARPAFKVHEFGGAVGGPILKDKLFFFTSYHSLRHNRGSISLLSVPTALERQGDFSKTLIRDASGAGVPAQIFDPWSVTQLGPDLYERKLIPNAIIPNPDPRALLSYSYYPDPNRTPDDVFNTNNFIATPVIGVRRQVLNNRIDYRRGAHSIYGSGGIEYATVTTPRPFGKAPFNDAASVTGDKNPYGQIGDVWVISPTLVADMRFGFNRIQTKAVRGNKTGFTAAEYTKYGVPTNIFPYMQIFGSAPGVNPNAFSGGSGGGSIWTNVSDVGYGNKREQQSNYTLASSITKSHGSWTHKFGGEARNLESNYQDMEEQSAQIASSYFHVGGNFNFQYVTANGSVASQNASNNQKGVNGAAMLLGAPSWFIRPGANMTPAFSQKYFALYSQNDWRASSKLTINLGLRWDLQPGPTERYNRMSGVDVTAKNPFGYQGALAFPGIGGYSRNLWDTSYDNWGPRVGAAYQLSSSTVVRGGFGVTYLPSNSGYFSGPTDYGSSMFSSGTMELPYGLTPQGVPVQRFYETTPLAIAVGADPAAPSIYGAAEARFDRHYKNGRAMQWNVFFEKTFAGSWFASAGYSASHSNNLMNRNFQLSSLQQLPQSTLDAWKAQYIASNGVTNPANVQVTNPFQPTSGPLLGFTGILGGKTIPQANTLYPWPLLAGLGLNQSKAWADYHSMQLRLSHAFSHGFHLDMNYTWSKEIDNTDNMEDNQGFNVGGGQAGNLDVKNLANNTKVGFSDIPHRFVATFLIDSPFGEGKGLEIQNRALRAIAGRWQVGGTFVAQQGMPFVITGDNSGAAYGHPDRAAGVPLEVPKELQRWYDGKTTVTLPDGRQIKPSKNTFLKWYEGAFSGRTILMSNGKYQPDVYWYGTVANTLSAMRNPGRYNIDVSLRRSFKIRERVSLELAADATNMLNHTQLNTAYNGNLGTTNTAVNATTGLKPGMGSSDTYGTITLGTFDPREVVMNLRFRF